MKLLLLICAGLSMLVHSQGIARYEEAKRLAFAYVQSEQFDRAVGSLEEIWENDKSDPSVAENLALAYLNSTEKKKDAPLMEKEAFQLIQTLFSNGQRVSFLVQHSHEKLAWLQGRELNQYCRGRISIAPGRIFFVAAAGDKAANHSFDVAQIRDISLNEEDRRGTFVLKSSAGSFFFAIRNRNRNEARLLVELVKRSLNKN